MSIEAVDFDRQGTPDERAIALQTPQPRRSKLLPVLLAISTVVCGAGWIVTAQQYAATTTELVSIKADLSSVTYQRDTADAQLSEERSHTSSELSDLRDKLPKILETTPLQITEIALTNTADDGHDLGNGPAEVFEDASLASLTIDVRGPNPFFGIQNFEGKLEMKFIMPQGDAAWSDTPFQTPVRFGKSDQMWHIQRSFGNQKKSFRAGTWHIRFFYRGNQIAEKAFTVR